MKKKIIIVSACIILAAAIGFCVFFFLIKENKSSGSRNEVTISRREIPELKPEVTYQSMSKPVYENLNMLQVSSSKGIESDMIKIFRALRSKNVAEAIAGKYCNEIHIEYILAIIAHESGGGEILYNMQNDGGFGWAHMQGSTACWLHLKTFDNCNAIICNGESGMCCVRLDTTYTDVEAQLDEQLESPDFDGYDYSLIDSSVVIDSVKKNHGQELRELYESYKDDPDKLVEIDDRFNMLLNVDAWVRYLLYYKSVEPPAEFNSSLEYAFYKCSGGKPEYWGIIESLAEKIKDPEYLQEIENKFNRINPSLAIDGEHADYEKFMQSCYKDNERYGLSSYRQSDRIKIR